MIFVSTMTYALGKELGFPEATAEFQRQLSDPDIDSLPCVRVIARLRSYDEVGIWHDASATCLGKARSRAFHAALGAKPDVYFTVDDDCEADAHTLGLMIEAVRYTDGVVLAPCITRGSNVVNVALAPEPLERFTESGGRLVRAVSGGFGIVAMNGATMRRLVDSHPTLHFLDDDNSKPNAPQIRKPALFYDLLEPVSPGSPENSWFGEDVAFCRRVHHSGLPLEALVTGVTSHAGQVLKLATVPELGTVQQR